MTKFYLVLILFYFYLNQFEQDFLSHVKQRFLNFQIVEAKCNTLKCPNPSECGEDQSIRRFPH